MGVGLVQGRPVGRHAAIAHKISFMAATTFAQQAVLDLSAQLADAGRHDIRIEAALAKLWSSEMAWLVADELVQIRRTRIRDGRVAAVPRRAGVPAEQILRDPRINRIFEGSSEIMHLLIAREAVDAHLQAAGDVIDPDVDMADKAKATARAAGFYARWLPLLVAGRGQLPSSYAEFGGLARHLRYVERSSRRLARQTFYGMARWQGGLERRQGFLARVVDIGAELFAMAASCVRAQPCVLMATSAPLDSPTCSAGRRGFGSSDCSTPCGRTPTSSTSGWPRRFSTAGTPRSSQA